MVVCDPSRLRMLHTKQEEEASLVLREDSPEYGEK
jgi:hypothetical protein